MVRISNTALTVKLQLLTLLFIVKELNSSKHEMRHILAQFFKKKVFEKKNTSCPIISNSEKR